MRTEAFSAEYLSYLNNLDSINELQAEQANPSKYFLCSCGIALLYFLFFSVLSISPCFSFFNCVSFSGFSSGCLPWIVPLVIVSWRSIWKKLFIHLRYWVLVQKTERVKTVRFSVAYLREIFPISKVFTEKRKSASFWPGSFNWRFKYTSVCGVYMCVNCCSTFIIWRVYNDGKHS